jgi:DNA-directed RNA polymerase specialized sigma24 family protein
MSRKAAPASSVAVLPEADVTPVDGPSEPASSNAGDAPKLVTSPEKKEIVGTLSSPARFNGQEEPARKMNPSPIDAAHVARVISVEVQKAIRSRLRNRGVWAQEIEDVAQDVTTELLHMPNPPQDLNGCLAVARNASNDESIDTFRKVSRRGAHNVGPTANADYCTAADYKSPEVWHPIDRERQVSLVRAKVADGTLSERDVKMLLLDAEGVNAIQIGRELKLKPQTVRNELSRARSVVRGAWAGQLKGPLVLLALLIVAWWLKREHDRQAQRDRDDIRPDIQFVPPPPPQPSPEERAEQLRRDAHDACAEKQWKKCSDDLDDASKLEPAGESRPEVQEMRKALGPWLDAQDPHDKPHGR